MIVWICLLVSVVAAAIIIGVVITAFVEEPDDWERELMARIDEWKLEIGKE